MYVNKKKMYVKKKKFKNLTLKIFKRNFVNYYLFISLFCDKLKGSLLHF